MLEGDVCLDMFGGALVSGCLWSQKFVDCCLKAWTWKQLLSPSGMWTVLLPLPYQTRAWSSLESIQPRSQGTCKWLSLIPKVCWLLFEAWTWKQLHPLRPSHNRQGSFSCFQGLALRPNMDLSTGGDVLETLVSQSRILWSAIRRLGMECVFILFLDNVLGLCLDVYMPITQWLWQTYYPHVVIHLKHKSTHTHIYMCIV